MDPLLPGFRRELRARAHALHPVVSIGQHGLTPAVLHEIDVALLAHELVKVRVFSDDRTARATMLERVCSELDCSPVQQIGKLLVVWRAKPPAEKEAPRPAAARRKPRHGAAPAPAGHAQVRRRRGDAPAPTGVTGRRSRGTAAAESPRPRTPGKAPAGVPRAAAPRRRRRTA